MSQKIEGSDSKYRVDIIPKDKQKKKNFSFNCHEIVDLEGKSNPFGADDKAQHYFASSIALSSLVEKMSAHPEVGASYVKAVVDVSGIACESASSYAGGFRPCSIVNQPGISAIQLFAMAQANSRPLVKECSYCDPMHELGSIPCSQSCGSAMCFQCLSVRYEHSATLSPFHCQCGGDFLINTRSDFTGFHQSWLCGHGTEGVAKLLSNLLVPSHDSLPKSFYEFVYALVNDIIDTYVSVPDGSIDIADFRNPKIYPRDIPVDSSIGLVYGVPMSDKKGDVYGIIIETLISVFNRAYELFDKGEDAAAIALIEEILGDSARSAIKVEVAGPKLDENGDFVDNRDKQRLFYSFSFFMFVVCKMLFAGFLHTGSGSEHENVPIGIGMRMAGCGETFFKEMFGDYSNCSPQEAEEQILRYKHVIHGDYSKYDFRVRHWIMQMCIQKLMRKFNLGTGTRRKFNMAILNHVAKVLVSKNILCPFSGRPIYIQGLLPSGHYLTAFMNSLINVVMQFAVVCIMTGKKFHEVRQSVKLKVYGDDFLMIILKTLLGVFDKERYSTYMKRLFNMIIPPSDIYQCTKIFNNGSTVDNNAPVYLQYQFDLFEKDGNDYIVMRRPFRPILSSKMFLSSERILSTYDVLVRLSCIAYLFAIRKADYDKIREIYDAVKVHWDGSLTDSPDEYINDKVRQVGVDVIPTVEFPKYDDVIELNFYECQYRGPRGRTMSWDDYRVKFESGIDRIYHIQQFEGL